MNSTVLNLNEKNTMIIYVFLQVLGTLVKMLIAVL